MIKIFTCINDFLKFKENCVWCGQPLTPKLTNYTDIISEKANPKSRLPLFKSKLLNDNFEFSIDFCSAEYFIKSKGSINTYSNEIQFNIDPISKFEGSNVDYGRMIDVFERFDPHVELHCNNKKCGMNYYVSSLIFTCEKASKIWGGAYYNFNDYTRIRPFNGYYEACNVDKYWIHNNHVNYPNGCTHIYSTVKTNSSPIKLELLDFSSFDKEKFKSRIRTIVTFA